MKIRVLDFEYGILNLVNGKPHLSINKIKGMVYENLHGLKVRYNHRFTIIQTQSRSMRYKATRFLSILKYLSLQVKISLNYTK